MKILITGGSGLLGSELCTLDPSLVAPLREEMDVTDFAAVRKTITATKPDIVLHCVMIAKPPEQEKNPELAMLDIIGAANVARACSQLGIRMVYASTDYVYFGSGPHKEDEPLLPPSVFGWSKVGGESVVQMVKNHLIVRLDFGPRPFPWEKVYKDKWVSKLYVDEIAPLVLAAAKSSATGVMNVGGPRITLEAYARQTRPDIETIPKPDWVPADTSLDLTKMKAVLDIDDEMKLLKHL